MVPRFTTEGCYEEIASSIDGTWLYIGHIRARQQAQL